MDAVYAMAVVVLATGGSLLLAASVLAIFSSLRLWVGGKRASAVLGAISGVFLGSGVLLMPLVLAIAASADQGHFLDPAEILDTLGEIFEEPWFLGAWAVLMLMGAGPIGLSGLALWLAAPDRAWRESSAED